MSEFDDLSPETQALVYRVHESDHELADLAYHLGAAWGATSAFVADLNEDSDPAERELARQLCEFRDELQPVAEDMISRVLNAESAHSEAYDE